MNFVYLIKTIIRNLYHLMMSTETTFQSELYQDLSFSLFKANMFSFLILAVSICVFFIPFGLVWDFDLLKDGLLKFLFELHISIPVLIAGTIVHELIHGLCFWLIEKNSLKNIKFGFDIRTFTPYTHCKIPVSAKTYMISAISPSFFLGFVPAFIGFSAGNALITIWGIVFVFLSGADLLTLWKIRNVDKKAMVLDHAERAGCFLVKQ